MNDLQEIKSIVRAFYISVVVSSLVILISFILFAIVLLYYVPKVIALTLERIEPGIVQTALTPYSYNK